MNVDLLENCTCILFGDFRNSSRTQPCILFTTGNFFHSLFIGVGLLGFKLEDRLLPCSKANIWINKLQKKLSLVSMDDKATSGPS